MFSDRKRAPSLYNALNRTNYTDESAIEIVTLSDAVYIHLRNDVSILFDNQITLWEHQSTLNCNMPLRGLKYFAHNISGILQSRGISLLKEYLQKKKMEVYDMLFSEFNQEAFVQSIREEGLLKGQIKMLYALIQDGVLSLEAALSRSGMTEPAFMAFAKK